MATKNVNLDLKVSTWGYVTGWWVMLEGVEIEDWTNNEKTLQDFPVDGKLNVQLIVKGVNGSSATLVIKKDKQEIDTRTVDVVKGRGVKEYELEV